MSEAAEVAGRSRLRVWAGRVLKSVGGLVAVVLLLLVLAVVFGVRIPVERFAGLLGPVIEGLGAEAEYAPGSYLEVSLNPELRLEELRLTGQAVRLEVAHFSGSVALLPLLRQQLVIKDVRLDTGRLDLTREETAPEPAAPAGKTARSRAISPWLTSLVVETAKVTDVRAVIRYVEQGKEWSFGVSDLDLTMPTPGNVTGTIGGSFQERPFSVVARSRRDAAGEWSLERLELEADSGRVLLTGRASADARTASGSLAVEIRDSYSAKVVLGQAAENLAPILLEADWNVAGHTGDAVIRELTVAGATFTGQLTADVADEVPELTLDLSSPLVDLSPWLSAEAASADAASPDSDPEPQAGSAREAPELPEAVDTPPPSGASAEAAPPLAELLQPFLDAADLDLRIGAEKMTGADVRLEAVEVGIGLKDGALRLPLSATVAGVPLSGAVTLETSGNQVSLRLPLEAPPSDIGELGRLLLTVDDLEGRHEGLKILAAADGENLRELLRSFRLDAQLAGAALRYGARPVQFRVASLDLRAGTIVPTRINGNGRLLGHPFDLSLESEPLNELADTSNALVDARLEGPGTVLALSGGRKQGRLDLSFGLETDDPEVMRDWLGLTPDRAIPLAIRGQLAGRASGQGLDIDLERIIVGRTEFSVTGALTGIDGRARAQARVRGPKVHVDDMLALFAAAPAASDASLPVPPESAAVSLDVPILPTEVSVFDSDLDVGLDRLVYGALALDTVTFRGRTREGQLRQSQFAAQTAYGALSGTATADFRSSEPDMQLALSVEPFRAGRLLADLEAAEGSDLDLDRVDASLRLRGATLDRLIETAEVDLRLFGGRIPVLPELGLDAVLSETRLRNDPGAPIVLSVDGHLGPEPLQASLSMVSLPELVETRRLGLDLDGRLGSFELGAVLQAPLPLGNDYSGLEVHLAGDRLDVFNELLDLNLPPWGPVRFSADVEHMGTRYALTDLDVGIGSSSLTGTMDLELVGKPELDVRLRAPAIQLDDFRSEGWKASAPAEPEEDADASEDERGDSARDPLLSKATFERANVFFRLDVDEVRSGPDPLGAGHLESRLENGVFTVPDLGISLPGGDFAATGRMAWPSAEELDTAISFSAEQFDYGVLARRIEPESTLKGDLTVHADLTGRHRAGQPFLAEANGTLGFAVWPEDFQSGVFDLWAVGLVSAVMPRFSDDAVSTMNCVIGRFTVRDGVLTEDALYANSSRIEVAGELTADFHTRRLDAYLVPKAKRAQIFSFASPVEVSGSFEDFSIGLKGGDVAKTVLRFVASPVVAPVRWLVEDPLPKDGAAACAEAWSRGGAPGAVP